MYFLHLSKKNLIYPFCTLIFSSISMWQNEILYVIKHVFHINIQVLFKK